MSLSRINLKLIIPILAYPVCLNAQFPPSICLSESHADITVLGSNTYDKTGWAFTSGDFNGDEFSDIAILSEGAFAQDGAAFLNVLWGGATQDSMIDLRDYHGDISVIYAAAGELGSSSSLSSGDYNHDGVDDILLGLPKSYPPSSYSGKAYIILGRSQFPDSLYLADDDPHIVEIFAVPSSGGWLGVMTTTGDINGDLFDDAIISAPAYYPGGRVYIIYGRDSFPLEIHLDTFQSTIKQVIDPYYFQSTGRGLACKDLNRDGCFDLLIGSPGCAEGYYQGKVSVLYGSSEWPDTIYLTGSSMGMKQVFGEYSNGQLGWRLAAGDVNGDGFEDLILSSLTADPFECEYCGEIYVIYGNQDWPDSLLLASNDVHMSRLIGTGIDQEYGVELICADLTGDRFEDIIITSKHDLGDQTDVDKVTVYYGSSFPPDTVFLAGDTNISVFHGENRQDSFGRGIGSADFNQDDILDLLIGAYRADPLDRTLAGKAYLFYGIDSAASVQPPPVNQLAVKQNCPNPFSAYTSIEYWLGSPAPVTVTIYNILGQRVAQIGQPSASAGPNIFTWNGLDDRGKPVASGLYLYHVESRGSSQTRKMVLLR